MPTNKTWTLRLTPPDAAASTLTDVPHDEMLRILRGMLYGARTEAAAAEPRPRAA
jgi:hypothetical protein